jgi:hypothetical protein
MNSKIVKSTNYIAGKFTVEASEFLTTASKKEASAYLAAVKAYDQMHIDGVLWTDFIPVGKEADGHKSTATEEVREAIFAARRAGFGVWAPKIYAAPVKSLSEADKARRSKLRTDVNKKVTDDRNAMRRRQDPTFSKKAKEATKSNAVVTGDKVVDEANKVNDKICKKVRDLQSFIEKHAAIKDAEVTKNMLSGVLATFSQVTK